MNLTRLLSGKRVRTVQTNGTLLALNLEDRSEVCIAWVDDNGKPINGRPVLHSTGFRMHARDIGNLIQIPR